MAKALRDAQMTPADELRELLTASEKLVVNLRDVPDGALRLLENLDRIAELWPELEAAGVDLRPESGRWETLQGLVRKQARTILGQLRPQGGLPALRARYHGDGKAEWWWYLAERTREETIRRARRAAVIAVALVALGAAVVFLLRVLFPVDPKVQASLSHRMAGQQKIEGSGDYAAALADFQEAVKLTPDDPEAWLWLGVTQEKLGDEDAARASFERARAVARSEIDFRLARASIYIALQMLDQARVDIEEVLQRDPENPQAYYFLASVLEGQGKYMEAAVALQRASDLAEARNNAELTAMARYRLAMMLQQLQVKSLPEPTPASP